MERPLTPDAPVTIRAATESDHPRLARLVRDWWGERPPQIERLWFRHFAPTTLVGETAGGRPVALAIGFQSAIDRARGVLLLVAVAPDARRRSVGRSMVAAVEIRLAASGVDSVEAVVWPGNRAGVRFLEALGYAPVPESLATPLYGVPAIADYDGDGNDRAVLVRDISAS